MTLTIEDGTGVVGANSYRALTDLRSWAALRGVDLDDPTVTDENLEVMAIKAMDYLERFRDRLKGSPVVAGQPLSFPRVCMYYEGVELASTVIPQRWLDAQCQLVVYISQGIELEPIQKGGGTQFLLRQKLGPIEREYSEAAFLATLGSTPIFYTVSDLIAPFLRSGGRQMMVSRA